MKCVICKHRETAPGQTHVVLSRGETTVIIKDVPAEVWEFHVGGYQVCDKWRKDRKGRLLSYDDLTHYRQIVAALAETMRLMDDIDDTIEEHGGWPLAGSVDATPVQAAASDGAQGNA